MGYYTPEQEKFRLEVREAVKEEIVPYAEDVEEKKIEIWDVIRRFAKSGYLGVMYPEAYGGLGKGLMEFVIVCEEVSAASLAVDMSMTASAYGFGALPGYLGKDVERYLVPIIKGEKIGAFCYTEPEAGSDLGRMKTVARKEGDEYVVNGEKRYITNGNIADYLLVYARNGAFVVEAIWEGFEVIEEYKMMGLHGLHLGHIKFNDVRVPEDNVVFYTGEEEKEVKVDEKMEKRRAGAANLFALMLGPERAYISAECLGVARAAFEVALKYSKEREQFHRPISEFEGISFKIAEMATKLEAMRLMTINAVNAVNTDFMNSGKVAAMAKLFNATEGFDICNEALQIFAGAGYTCQYPVERYLRDIRLLGIGGGTNEIMKYAIQRDLYKELEGGII